MCFQSAHCPLNLCFQNGKEREFCAFRMVRGVSPVLLRMGRWRDGGEVSSRGRGRCGGEGGSGEMREGDVGWLEMGRNGEEVRRWGGGEEVGR